MKKADVIYDGVRNTIWVGGHIVSASTPDSWCILLANRYGLSTDQLITTRDRLAENRPWIAWIEAPNTDPSPIYRCQAQSELGAKREAHHEFRGGCRDVSIILGWQHPYSPESEIDRVATRRIGGDRWEYI